MTTNPLNRRRLARAFGHVLRTVRTGKGVSQEQMAHDSEIDRTYPSLLERGLRTPTLLMLINLGHALGVEPALLVSMTTTRLGRRALHEPLENIPLGHLIEGATFNASPLDAGAQALHCERMAHEIDEWAKEASDADLGKQREQLAGMFRTAAREWRRKERHTVL